MIADWNGLNPTLPWRPVVFLSWRHLKHSVLSLVLVKGLLSQGWLNAFFLDWGPGSDSDAFLSRKIMRSQIQTFLFQFKYIQVLYPILSPKSLFIDVYRFISVNLFQEVQPSRSLTLLLAAKCRDHRSKIRNSTCATLAAIARGGGKELLGSLGLSAEAESEVLTSVPWLPMVTPMLPQLFHGTSLLLNVER